MNNVIQFARRQHLIEHHIEKMYLKNKRQSVYVALEDMDFVWDVKDVLVVDHMWNGGFSIWDIARAFDRDPDEILILIVDRVRKGKIKLRPGGVYGQRRKKSHSKNK